MTNTFLRIRYFLAMVITVLLGPGIGHLLIFRYKKAIMFILASALITFGLALYLSGILGQKEIELLKHNPLNFFQFVAENQPNALKVYNVLFAALWAYAILDLFLDAKKSTKEESREKLS
ncbi:MAG: hypothetical protein M0Q46_01015 [Endomicrobiales bacterium]|nr:hypothetical protein [Endomicrobiales bacterium]